MLYLDEKPSFILQEKLVLAEKIRLMEARQPKQSKDAQSTRLNNLVKAYNRLKDVCDKRIKAGEIARTVKNSEHPTQEEFDTLKKAIAAAFDAASDDWKDDEKLKNIALAVSDDSNVTKELYDALVNAAINDANTSKEIQSLTDGIISKLEEFKKRVDASGKDGDNDLQNILWDSRLTPNSVKKNTILKSSDENILNDLKTAGEAIGVSVQQNTGAAENSAEEKQEEQEKKKSFSDKLNEADEFLARYNAATGSEEKQEIWVEYTNKWAKAWGFAANDDGGQCLRRLGETFKNEILKLGSNPLANPFIIYLRTIHKIYENKDKDIINKISLTAYTAVHNAVASNSLGVDDITGKGEFKAVNVVFSAALLESDSTMMKKYLEFQKTIKGDMNRLTDYTDETTGETINFSKIYGSDDSDDKRKLLYNVIAKGASVEKSDEDGRCVYDTQEKSGDSTPAQHISKVKSADIVTRWMTILFGKSWEKPNLETDSRSIEMSKWYKHIDKSNYKAAVFYLTLKFSSNQDVAKKLRERCGISQDMTISIESMEKWADIFKDNTVKNDVDLSKIVDKINKDFGTTNAEKPNSDAEQQAQ